MAQRASRKRGRREPPPRRAAAPPAAGDEARGESTAPPPARGPREVVPPGSRVGRARSSAPARGQRPNQWFAPTGAELTRSQRRDAEARAKLIPLAPGERPGPVKAAVVVAALLGLGNLIAYAAGETIGGKRPAGAGILVFSGLMIVCAIGMWRLWYGAVLGFMALLAIIATVFVMLLIEASNILGVVVALAVVVGAGYLFFKLVRVLSRIQMPRSPAG